MVPFLIRTEICQQPHTSTCNRSPSSYILTTIHDIVILRQCTLCEGVCIVTFDPYYKSGSHICTPSSCSQCRHYGKGCYHGKDNSFWIMFTLINSHVQHLSVQLPYLTLRCTWILEYSLPYDYTSYPWASELFRPIHVYTHTHTHTHTQFHIMPCMQIALGERVQHVCYSYKTLIGVHEMHGRCISCTPIKVL